MKVRCYRNLHKNCYSVVDMKTGRVHAHLQSLLLKDARFRVSEAGRQRVLREKKKNVHAFVVGELASNTQGVPDLQPKEAWYNPYRVSSFVNKRSKRPLHHAAFVYLGPGGMLYWK